MLDATQLKGWGGVGHVNVPFTLHTCWMLHNGRVGVGWGKFVLLPNRRSLLIPPALKVHSLLRCLLPSCDQDSQNPTRAA